MDKANAYRCGCHDVYLISLQLNACQSEYSAPNHVVQGGYAKYNRPGTMLTIVFWIRVPVS